MSMTFTNPAEAAMDRFQSETSRYGSITMACGLLCSLIGPAYLVLFSDFGITFGQVLTAFVAVAATFGVFWILEPVTYFPILGPAAMYQAFMIGNISNKLLPAAVVAQSSVGAKPGTKRGDLAAVMAICGAATVHLSTLFVFVGIFGTWLVSIVPADVVGVAREYILPSLMGAVLVQAIWTLKQLRPTIVAVTVALLVQFALVPAWADAALYAVALCVLTTVVLSWVLRDRRTPDAAEIDAVTDAEGRI